ncbi:hypothetical protein SAMN04487866_12523 [Thermoactinomyces sp. DSM 45891]|uniref:hypothetical protein n=1 Tax=Thermoactinomyces sp. DSM 45891 TaxID=1761907 RepID=UPI0009228A7A|nr:hypothetical protein [Thermoactinomyces sp. DSM 45891]SFX78395.1 hypothetical protein SAMN04487866_12523 [Thermoactinomyces sp. DSM 45891]
MDGWIKLHRKLCQSDLYKQLNSKQRDVFIAILLMVNHKDNQWEFKGEIFTVKPGQVVTSLEKIKENCGNDVSIQSIRTALLKLEKWGFLTNKSTKTGRLITLVNWEVYQSSSEEDQQSDQQTSNNPLTPNKNVKNEKKKDKKDYSRKQNVYDDESPYMKMAQYLQKQILSWKPNARTPDDLNKWADEFRKLVELDKRTKQEIQEVTDFATTDHFWQANILSASKLRAQFDQLQAHKARKSQPAAVVSLKDEREKKQIKSFEYQKAVGQFVSAGFDPETDRDLLEKWLSGGMNVNDLQGHRLSTSEC